MRLLWCVWCCIPATKSRSKKMNPATRASCTIQQLHHRGNLVETQGTYRFLWSILKVLPAPAPLLCLRTQRSSAARLQSLLETNSLSPSLRSDRLVGISPRPKAKQCWLVSVWWATSANILLFAHAFLIPAGPSFLKLHPPQERNTLAMHELQSQKRKSSKDSLSHDKSGWHNVAAKDSWLFE